MLWLIWRQLCLSTGLTRPIELTDVPNLGSYSNLAHSPVSLYLCISSQELGLCYASGGSDHYSAPWFTPWGCLIIIARACTDCSYSETCLGGTWWPVAWRRGRDPPLKELKFSQKGICDFLRTSLCIETSDLLRHCSYDFFSRLLDVRLLRIVLDTGMRGLAAGMCAL